VFGIVISIAVYRSLKAPAVKDERRTNTEYGERDAVELGGPDLSSGGEGGSL
jgi:hypothetical protein